MSSDEDLLYSVRRIVYIRIYGVKQRFKFIEMLLERKIVYSIGSRLIGSPETDGKGSLAINNSRYNDCVCFRRVPERSIIVIFRGVTAIYKGVVQCPRAIVSGHHAELHSRNGMPPPTSGSRRQVNI